MNKKQKEEYSRYVGFGLILGTAIGASIDFFDGFTGFISASGTGVGIVIGAIIGHFKIYRKRKQ